MSAANQAKKKLPSELEEKLSELRREHGAIVHFTDRRSGATFCFRPPSLQEWEGCMNRIRKGEVGPAQRELCNMTLVHGGTPESLAAIFEKAPRVPTMVADELGELAEDGIEVVVKKD